MKKTFKGLTFDISDGKITLIDCLGFAGCKDEAQKSLFNFVEVQLAGENQAVHAGAKHFQSSEWSKLKYIAYSEMNDRVEIVQVDSKITVSTCIQAYEDTDALKIWSFITNTSGEPITLEHVSSFVFNGIGDGTDYVKDLYLYRFFNSHHIECQPVKLSFYECGMFNGNARSLKRLYGSNTGSWSSKEELPQAIIEDAKNDKFFMFQIESNCSWYWEIGDNQKLLYLNLGGPNQKANQWSKTLLPNQSFRTVDVAIAVGNSINQVVGEMSKYRRRIVRPCKADASLPVIFNEYMHLSWDNPNEERVRKVAPVVAALGAKYYVIDCGWHDECEYYDIYSNVGRWESSNKRFPSGIAATVAYIKSLGLKAGLWIEPEIVGYKNKAIIDFYGDDCFMHRNGKKIIQSNRLFLDFRKEKVRKKMTEVVDRMIGDGVSYIKFDYNQDVGAGNELESDSLGDGLIGHAEAYFKWVSRLMDRYPKVIFECCASGGQRLDYKTLSLHPLVSTSDQTDYLKYPYIVGNILSAVLPEQAAVWSYPVNALSFTEFDSENYERVNARISEEQIIINMVNSFLGRMHLASAVHLLSEEKLELIKEGVDYYNSVALAKKCALPYFPLGFTNFYQKRVASGFVSKKKIYLAVWKLDDESLFEIPVDEYEIKSAVVVYPKKKNDKINVKKHKISFNLDEDKTARFIEIDLV